MTDLGGLWMLWTPWIALGWVGGTAAEPELDPTASERRTSTPSGGGPAGFVKGLTLLGRGDFNVALAPTQNGGGGGVIGSGVPIGIAPAGSVYKLETKRRSRRIVWMFVETIHCS